MTQFIESTPGTIAAAMQQGGTNYSQMPMQQGFAEGGLASLPRGGYMGGGEKYQLFVAFMWLCQAIMCIPKKECMKRQLSRLIKR